MSSIAISLRRANPPMGDVILTNGGKVALRAWRTGNRWGDEMLRFEVARGAAQGTVSRKPQIYTRNVPSSVEVAAGAELRIPFDLGDGTWQLELAGALLAGPDSSLVAVYDVPASPEAALLGVWMGKLRSAPVVLSRLEAAP